MQSERCFPSPTCEIELRGYLDCCVLGLCNRDKTGWQWELTMGPLHYEMSHLGQSQVQFWSAFALQGYPDLHIPVSFRAAGFWRLPVCGLPGECHATSPAVPPCAMTGPGWQSFWVQHIPAQRQVTGRQTSGASSQVMPSTGGLVFPG